MEATQFDRVARAVGQGMVRRRLLGGLVGAALAAPLGRAAADDTPKPNGKKCNKDAQCLSGFCDRGEGGKRGTCGGSCIGVICGQFCVPESCGPGGSRDESCFCNCSGGEGCIVGAVCSETSLCPCLPGWEICRVNFEDRRCVPNCPAGQTLDQSTCLCAADEAL